MSEKESAVTNYNSSLAFQEFCVGDFQIISKMDRVLSSLVSQLIVVAAVHLFYFEELLKKTLEIFEEEDYPFNSYEIFEDRRSPPLSPRDRVLVCYNQN